MISKFESALASATVGGLLGGMAGCIAGVAATSGQEQSERVRAGLGAGIVGLGAGVALGLIDNATGLNILDCPMPTSNMIGGSIDATTGILEVW